MFGFVLFAGNNKQRMPLPSGHGFLLAGGAPRLQTRARCAKETDVPADLPGFLSPQTQARGGRVLLSHRAGSVRWFLVVTAPRPPPTAQRAPVCLPGRRRGVQGVGSHAGSPVHGGIRKRDDRRHRPQKSRTPSPSCSPRPRGVSERREGRERAGLSFVLRVASEDLACPLSLTLLLKE